MEGKRFIKRIKVQNLLSFDEEGIDLELQPLNVLIGANGSGKSNLIDAIRVLRSTSNDIVTLFSSEGGIKSWLHSSEDSGTPTANIEVELLLDGSVLAQHQIAFTMIGQKVAIESESVNLNSYKGKKAEALEQGWYTLYHFDTSGYFLNRSPNAEGVPSEDTTKFLINSIRNRGTSESVVKTLWDRQNFPEINDIAETYRTIGVYSQFSFGRNQPARLPQQSDLPGTFLFEDSKNLGAVLNEMKRPAGLFKKAVELIHELYPRVSHIEALPSGGTIQVYIRESSVYDLIPATRLSDGTMRLLSLLAILLHPSPPPLVCIEEPELGLHPDMIHKVADLLVEASKRMQIIVTTHSDLLVSALNEQAEAVVICEHDGKGTRMNRLNSEHLKTWLKDFSLGDLWIKGELGGTRW